MSTARRILIVEDSDTDAHLVIRRIKRARAYLKVDRVRDGEECMAYLRDETNDLPDLILLDLNMPAKDGREVLGELRADPELYKIPVVVLTSSDLDSDRAKAYALQANAYVLKPGDVDEYERVMSDLDRFWLDTNRFA